MEDKAIFYGVSVGPGDPQLITLAALRAVEACPVIAAPQAPSGRTLALDILRGAADLTGKAILPLPLAMTRDKAILEEEYRHAADLGPTCRRGAAWPCSPWGMCRSIPPSTIS